ncbi:hypothetical protein ABZ468_54375 [Streptomyces sp. NPDC005708]|uniref:hypothetical protein n=1 Tax=unclassified Streptomyces TaxID=2593676 RepID=UPI0033EAA124
MIVTGRLRQPTVDDKQGQRRISIEINVEDVAVSLTYATAQAAKTFRNSDDYRAYSVRWRPAARYRLD